MVKSNASYASQAVSEGARVEPDRLAPGPAMLVVLGLSLVGWACVLAPLVAILHH
jgi:hypothetical protein